MTIRVLCFGAGGHASVVVDLLQRLHRTQPIEIAGIVAREPVGSDVLGVPVLGTDDELKTVIEASGATHFVVAIGTTKGGNRLRKELFDLGSAAGLEPFTAIHSSAIVAESAVVGPGSVVMAGVVIQPRCRIGANAIINTRASIDHDCIVADHAHVAPGVVCSGSVSIGAGAHIGVGAVILQNVQIGSDATVGAGATVIRDCKAGATVVGLPARPIART